MTDAERMAAVRQKYTQTQLEAFERPQPPETWISIWQWLANRANNLFEDYGAKDRRGRGGEQPNIRPETIRDAELNRWGKSE